MTGTDMESNLRTHTPNAYNRILFQEKMYEMRIKVFSFTTGDIKDIHFSETHILYIHILFCPRSIFLMFGDKRL